MAYMKNFKVVAKDENDNLTLLYTTNSVATVPFPTDANNNKLTGDELMQALTTLVSTFVITAEAPMRAVTIDENLDSVLGLGNSGE
jgi:hypothetical protein